MSADRTYNLGKPVPAGSLIGRLRGGDGPAVSLSVADLASELLNTGQLLSTGSAPLIVVSAGSGISVSQLNTDYTVNLTTPVSIADGGTNADLSATGGTSQVLKQVSSGAAITVGQLAAADLSNGTTGTGAVVLASAISGLGSGSVTSVASGSGLTGGPITTTGTLSIASGGVTNAMLAGSIAASKLIGTDIATVGTITTGTWNGAKIGLLYGGTNADLSATGGTSQVLKQVSSGAAITVGQLATSDLSDIASFSPNTSGTITTTNSTASTTTTTGAVIVTGGVGIGGAINVGAASSIAGLTVTSAFTATGLVTNADLAGSIAASKLIGTDIATVGTITTGTWNGTAIANAYLANDAVTVGSTSITLGATAATISGLTVSAGTLTGTTTIPAGQITATTGALLLGTATAISVDGTSAAANRLQVYNDPSTFLQFTANTSGVLNYYGKSRGSVTTAAVVVTGDFIGRLIFAGDDGSTNGAIPIKGAEYSIACSDTISTGIVPMRHFWGTMNSGGTYSATRMTLFSSGGLNVGGGTDPGVGVINANNGLTAGGIKVAPTNPVQKSVATVTGTTSTTGVMMGLAAAITPAATVGTGNILINVCGDCFNATAIADGGQIQIRYGTGTAPANAAALTGTAVGGLVTYVQATVADKYPFALNAVVTGLTLGTAYWIDVSLAALTGGTATIENVSVSIIEI